MRTIVFGSLLLFVLQACGNASSPEYESGDGTARHVSIAYLKSLCRGVLHPVTEDLWIEGCVVGNDLYGEFPDALVVAITPLASSVNVQGCAGASAKTSPCLGFPLSIMPVPIRYLSPCLMLNPSATASNVNSIAV